jgi:hypothetical protein
MEVSYPLNSNGSLFSAEQDVFKLLLYANHVLVLIVFYKFEYYIELLMDASTSQ